MPRNKTIKNLKYHDTCKCGANEVDDARHSAYSLAELKAMGYKKRKFKDTGEVFYFLETALENCPSCSPELYD